MPPAHHYAHLRIQYPSEMEKRYCKVQNINVEVILATLTSGSDSLILRSGNICTILYSNCVSSHYYTWSVDNHTYIHRHMYVHAVIYKCLYGVQPNLNDAHNNS